MKTRALLVVGLLACVAAAMLPSNKNSAMGRITGDYVEARTASVFAGACHYQGEFVTVGREAVMAWSFTGGSHDGVSLAGVRAAAAIAADANLDDKLATRKSEIVIDSSATEPQVEAAVALIKSRAGDQLGTVVAVRRAPISFTHSEDGYKVNVQGFASLTVQPMPDSACCATPGMVWGSPLSPIDGRKVGYTETASYTGTITEPWTRISENNAFYGPIAF